MRILHFADTHIGGRSYDVALEVVENILKENIDRVDLAVWVGDVFHGPVLMDRQIDRLFKAIENFAARNPLVIIRGNSTHDIDGSLSILGRIKGVWIAQDTPVVHQIQSTQIVCLPTPEPPRSLGENYEEHLTNLYLELEKLAIALRGNYEGRSILLYHGMVRGCELGNGIVAPYGLNVAVLEEYYDYLALGHIHRMQKVGDRSYYPGSTYYVDHGEITPRYYLLVDLENGVEVKPQRIQNIYPPITILCRVFTEDGELRYRDVEIRPDPTGIPDFKALVRIRYTCDAVTAEILSHKKAIDLLTPLARDWAAGPILYERIVLPPQEEEAKRIVEQKTIRAKILEWGRFNDVESIDDETLDLAEKYHEQARESEE